MVQISKLNKDEIKSTGFNNKAIASKFLKTVLNKKARDFKKKEDFIKTLKKEYKKMADFGIDLNETSKIDRTVRKIEKSTKNIENIKEQFNNYLIENMDDEAVQELKIQEYFKRIDYKVPKNRDYKIDRIDKDIDKTDQNNFVKLWLLKQRKIKNKFYYEWQGMEDVLQTITDLYRKQDTAFKFNISLAYLLRRPMYEREYNEEGE
jgi:hypothetical protein